MGFFVMRNLSGKRIFITGVCGTVGLALVEKLLEDEQYRPSEIIGVDNNESALFFLDQSFVAEPRVQLFLLDIRDREELAKRMVDVDIELEDCQSQLRRISQRLVPVACWRAGEAVEEEEDIAAFSVRPHNLLLSYFCLAVSALKLPRLIFRAGIAQDFVPDVV